jgi:hypothetical protein
MPAPNRVLTLDLHAEPDPGLLRHPARQSLCRPGVLQAHEETLANRNLTVVSPDTGGVVRARAIAKRVDADLAIIDKRREKAGVSEVMNVIGDVKNADCILIDDIVDSAGTLCNAAVALMDQGAKSVSAYVTHGVLVGRRGGARRRLADGEAGDHRFDPADQGDAGGAQPAAAADRAADGRGDQAHFRGDLGVEPVRLEGIQAIRRWAPLEATPR